MTSPAFHQGVLAIGARLWCGGSGGTAAASGAGTVAEYSLLPLLFFLIYFFYTRNMPPHFVAALNGFNICYDNAVLCWVLLLLAPYCRREFSWVIAL